MFHYSGMNFPTHYAHARGNRGPAMYCQRALLKGEGVNVVKVFCVCVCVCDEWCSCAVNLNSFLTRAYVSSS